MILRQFLHQDPTVAVSYLLGCASREVAAIVDPIAPAEWYTEAADEMGVEIRYVIDTHLHADHVSTGRELVERAGAEYVLGPDSGAAYPHRSVVDGEELGLGNVVLTVLHTPGHTPEHLTLLVTDRTRGEEPWCMLTGHTLMIGDMGRTELVTEAAEGAEALFDTARRLRDLPEHVAVLPGAFSGSVCGRGLSGNPISTLGFEKRFNRALTLTERKAFVEFMLRSTPPPPANAEENRALNLGLAVAAM